MFSIGDFARHGQVSVRMLRHYDAIGLLPPARVDPATGYRSYAATQLARLNRVVALKDLGFTLQQVAAILDEKVDSAELRGMLRLRQAELQAQLSADTARLAQVDLRLRLIESEGTLPMDDITIKTIPGVRLAELTGFADGFYPEAITPVIGPLYESLWERVGGQAIGPAIAWYSDAQDGVLVHAGIPVGPEFAASDGIAIVDLAPIPTAATIVHRGPMDSVLSTMQTLSRWLEANGYRSTGYHRELYVEYGMGSTEDWVTELQEPIEVES